MSAQEAAERAKAIMAKFTGGATTTTPSSATTTTTTTPSSGSKRRRWGVAPDDATATPAANNNTSTAADASKRSKSDSAETVSKRMWISTQATRPAAHFVSFMKDDLEALSSKVLSEQDKASDKTVTATLEGRGSGGRQSVMGMPTEPLHVLIQASNQSLLSAAEVVVDELLNRAEEADVHPDLLAAAAEQEGDNPSSTKKKTVASTSLALATIQDPTMLGASSTTSYKPASVATLIGNNPDHGGAGGGGGVFDEIVQVPIGVTGFIIGKGGENIASMQNRTGAKVQVMRDAEPGGSQPTHRKIQISAPTADSLEQCKQLIENIVKEKSLALGGGPGGVGSGNMNRKDAMRLEEALAMGHKHVTVQVPDQDVGLVIGKAGATIRSLQDRSGSNIQVPSAQESVDGKRTIHITHPNLEGAEMAQKLIQELIANNNASQGGGTNTPLKPAIPQVTATMLIPDGDVGLIIGRNGTVIKFLQDSTRTKIQIPSECIPGQAQRLASITGPNDGVVIAQSMMAQIVADQSSAGIMAQASAAGGGPGMPQFGHGRATQADIRNQEKLQEEQKAPGEGDKNYNSEWAAYHAATQAATQAAQAAAPSPYPGHYYSQQQQQQRQPHHQQQGWGEQQSQAPAPDAYYEQFFRYSYYYGEAAARQYYGAWSPPPGTPNPYGSNPSGVQQAPAPGPSAAPPSGGPPSTADAGGQQQQPAEQPRNANHPVGRETGVRKHSNLPAWMSKST